MSNKALAGLRVIEFGPYVARPLTGRILGSLGAEIIKVETNKVLERWPSSRPGRAPPLTFQPS